MSVPSQKGVNFVRENSSCIDMARFSSALIARLFAALLVVPAAFAACTFDVASIRLNDSGTAGSSLGPGPGGGIRATNVTALQLITFANDFRDFQVEGGPDWLRTVRFDVTAKEDAAASTVSPRDMNAAQRESYINRQRECMQTLLQERFQLAAKLTSKELQGYVLTVGKNGHKLQPTTSPEQNQSMRTNSGNVGRIEATATPISNLATSLSSILRRKVLDQTGITGAYDFKLDWTPEAGSSEGGELAVTANLFTAIQEQLGLKLESKKIPLDVIVIERLEKPSDN